MSYVLVKDYVETQGFNLPLEEVQVAHMTLNAILAMQHTHVATADLLSLPLILQGSDGVYDAAGRLDSERLNLLPYFKNDAVEIRAGLAGLNACLDSITDRHPLLRVSVYALLPDMAEPGEMELVCMANMGRASEGVLLVNEQESMRHHASRVAKTAWGVVVDDVPYWVSLGELSQVRDPNTQSEMCLPICTETGAVVGVVHAESERKHAFDEATQSWLVALALAAEPVITAMPWLHVEDHDQDDEQG
ncbi:hypothetical protein AB8Q18_10790 [Neisseriaceae bacterium CLB008]|nr:hypothetical protein [Neisseriaceae bacterium]